MHCAYVNCWHTVVLSFQLLHVVAIAGAGEVCCWPQSHSCRCVHYTQLIALLTVTFARPLLLRVCKKRGGSSTK